MSKVNLLTCGYARKPYIPRLFCSVLFNGMCRWIVGIWTKDGPTESPRRIQAAADREHGVTCAGANRARGTDPLPRTKKPEPIESFKTNMADAEALVAYARHFTNQRVYSMRRELRSRIGDALRIPQREQDDLDCIESDGLFLVFKPGGGIGRQDFADLRPCSGRRSSRGARHLRRTLPTRRWSTSVPPSDLIARPVDSKRFL